MNAIDAMAHMMKTARWSGTELSRAMGKTRNWYSATTYQGSTPKADTLAKAAGVMGYELVLRGHGEEIVVDSGESEKV